VQRLVFIDDSEDSGHELVALKIGEFAEACGASEVGGVEGVTAGATQGAFLGDFDG
jgi:hypothetical protein